MDQLAEVVKQVVFSYAGGGANLRAYPLANDEQKVYSVIVVDWPIRHRPAGVVVVARIDGDKVIVEEDLTDRPLIDALVQAGVPREKISMAYADETAQSV